MQQNGRVKELAKRARMLEYQDDPTSEYALEYLHKTEYFLHFGLKSSGRAQIDKLPYTMRVYVTPKVWAAGDIAAMTIEKAREARYEPYGKILDTSTNETDEVSERKDRLLFYVSTQTELNIILDSLKEIQEEHPDMFEDSPVLLAKKIGIPGVGLAEEPPKSEFRESFNSSREWLVSTAWSKTLESIIGKPKNDSYVRSKTMPSGPIQGDSFYEFRDAVEQGLYPKENLVAIFRRHLKETAVLNGVDPDDISRNLR